MYIYETIHEMVNTLDNKKKKLFVYMLLTRQKNVYDYLAENKMWDQREQIENIFQKFSTCAVAIWLGAAIKQQKYNSHILPYVL